jgi:hypothetical protein
VAQDGIEVVQPEQGMHEAAVAHIDLGSTHEAFAHVAAPGGQAPHQHEVAQQVDVAAHRLAADAQRAGQPGLVQQLSLVVGQHGPQATQGAAGNPRAQRGYVSFQVGGDEGVAPGQAGCVAFGQPGQREAAAQPQPVHVGGRCRWSKDFARLKGCELHLRHAPGQAFAGLLQQHAGRGTQQQELSTRLAAAAALVDDTPKNAEHSRHALHFVQDHQLVRVCREEGLCIVEPPLCGGKFQVQVKGVRVGRLSRPSRPSRHLRQLRQLRHLGECKRRLAGLAGPEQNHRRKLHQKITQALLGESALHPCILSIRWRNCIDISRDGSTAPARSSPCAQ